MLKICITHTIQSQVAKSLENKSCKILLQILLQIVGKKNTSLIQNWIHQMMS